MSIVLKLFPWVLALVSLPVLSACSESFTDVRDGQSYNVVQIGSQTWMAENLNFALPSAMGGASKNFCPDGDERNCKKMGRLYTWAEAQSVCPEGWHLPTREDFETLVKVAGGSTSEGVEGSSETSGYALKSTSGWFKKGNGSDAFGFRALPAGYMAAAESVVNSEADDSYAGKFDGIGGYAYFWSATTDEKESAFAHYLFLDFSSSVAELKSFDKFSARSVRCVK